MDRRYNNAKTKARRTTLIHLSPHLRGGGGEKLGLDKDFLLWDNTNTLKKVTAVTTVNNCFENGSCNP